MLQRELGVLVWVVELQVGFSTWGLLLLPWDHPCAELVTQQWIGRIQGGVKLQSLSSVGVERSPSRQMEIKMTKIKMKCV